MVPIDSKTEGLILWTKPIKLSRIKEDQIRFKTKVVLPKSVRLSRGEGREVEVYFSLIQNKRKK